VQVHADQVITEFVHQHRGQIPGIGHDLRWRPHLAVPFRPPAKTLDRWPYAGPSIRCRQRPAAHGGPALSQERGRHRFLTRQTCPQPSASRSACRVAAGPAELDLRGWRGAELKLVRNIECGAVGRPDSVLRWMWRRLPLGSYAGSVRR
jgi:hypothetical protein